MKPSAILAFTAALLLSALILISAEAAETKSCSTNADCAKTQFCDTTPKCPGEGVTGTCRQIPMICTKEYVPVTGCNGRVYANRCEAASDGQPNTGPSKAE